MIWGASMRCVARLRKLRRCRSCRRIRLLDDSRTAIRKVEVAHRAVPCGLLLLWCRPPPDVHPLLDFDRVHLGELVVRLYRRLRLPRPPVFGLGVFAPRALATTT